MRLIYITLACFSLAIAFLGILLPGLPATEFILLSVWLAGKGSPRLQSWMLRQPMIATIYHDWHNGKVIQLKFKVWSSVSMTFCLIMMIWLIDHTFSVLFAATGMAIGACYIWSRPHSEQAAGAKLTANDLEVTVREPVRTDISRRVAE